MRRGEKKNYLKNLPISVDETGRDTVDNPSPSSSPSLFLPGGEEHRMHHTRGWGWGNRGFDVKDTG